MNDILKNMAQNVKPLEDMLIAVNAKLNEFKKTATKEEKELICKAYKDLEHEKAVQHLNESRKRFNDLKNSI